MPSINAIDPDVQQDLIDRLKRIEGQARGIQKMIQDGRDCEQIMNQVTAMKAASHALTGEVLEAYALYCVQHTDQFSSAEKAVAQMVRLVVSGSR